jgi:excisionase family DNA binding protein
VSAWYLDTLAAHCAYICVVDHAIEQRYLSVAETAAYLGLSPKTIYCWAEKSAMPAYKVGRVWRFDRTELDDFVRGQKRQAVI